MLAQSQLPPLPESVHSLVLSNLQTPIFIIGRDYRITWSNLDDAEFGQTDQCISGRHCYTVYLKRRKPCPECPVRIVWSTNRSYTGELWIPQINGSGRWVEVRAYPVRDEQGRVVSVLKMGFDVSDKKIKEQKLEKYIETLERALFERTREEARDLSSDHTISDRHGLTERELEVTRLMAGGMTNVQIASILSISRHTVKTHVTHIYNKLGFSDRAQTAAWAARRNII